MVDSFWEGGRKDLAKIIADQSKAKIKALQSKLAGTNDPQQADQLRSSIEEVKSDCAAKLREISDSLF